MVFLLICWTSLFLSVVQIIRKQYMSDFVFQSPYWIIAKVWNNEWTRFGHFGKSFRNNTGDMQICLKLLRKWNSVKIPCHVSRLSSNPLTLKFVTMKKELKMIGNKKCWAFSREQTHLPVQQCIKLSPLFEGRRNINQNNIKTPAFVI